MAGHPIGARPRRRHAQRSISKVGSHMNDALGGVQSVLVLGGTSELALATLKALDLRPGATVALAGRHLDALSAVQIPTSGGGTAKIVPLAWDAADTAAGPKVITDAAAALGDIDLVLV